MPADGKPKQDPARRQFIQASLMVGSATDPLEAEADRLADAVLARLGSGGDAHSEGVATDTPVAPAARVSRIQRSTAPLPAFGPGGGAVDDHLDGRISAARRGGSALPGPLRSRLEGAFGADFADVRTHTGAEASSLNQELGARAFTVGNDIFFAQRQFAPGTSNGLKLLAHELAHTVQQSGGVKRSGAERIQRDGNFASRADALAAQRAASDTMGAVARVQSALTPLSGIAKVVMPMVAQAVAVPAMADVISVHKTMLTSMLTQVEPAAAALKTAWDALKPIAEMFDATKAAVPGLDSLISNLVLQVETWKELIKNLGPGALNMAAKLASETGIAAGAIPSLGMALAQSVIARASQAMSTLPVAPAVVNAPPPVVNNAPPVVNNAPPVVNNAPPPVVNNAPPPVVNNAPPPVVNNAPPVVVNNAPPPVVNNAPPVVVPAVRPGRPYPRVKQKDAHYATESTDGSADLPLILRAGEVQVARGLVPSIDDFMKKQFGWTQADVNKYVHRKEKATVKYLNENERENFELNLGGTITQSPAKRVFDTTNMFSKHSGKGFGIYVMAQNGAMYADQHKVGLFHHSSFLAGADVAAAGELKVEAGKVKHVTNKTGHYKAGPEELWQMLRQFHRTGTSFDGAHVSLVGQVGNYAGGAKQFYQDYKPAWAN